MIDVYYIETQNNLVAASLYCKLNEKEIPIVYKGINTFFFDQSKVKLDKLKTIIRTFEQGDIKVFDEIKSNEFETKTPCHILMTKEYMIK